MLFKPLKTSTDLRLRSLVQKAVRRGCLEVVQKSSRLLFEIDNKSWLRSRTAVITFEECWPLAGLLLSNGEFSGRAILLNRVTSAKKNKDAAGLGALAFAFHQGDKSALSLIDEPKPIKFVAKALSRPDAFFDWVTGECASEGQLQIVEAAKVCLSAATWEWDKACVLAGAYLASCGTVPAIQAALISHSEFPYWVALDKHTHQGRIALRKAANALHVPLHQITWASFYFESALTNELFPSPWWEAEKSWRLRKVGLSVIDAEQLWDYMQPTFRVFLRDEATSLQEFVELGTSAQKQIEL